MTTRLIKVGKRIEIESGIFEHIYNVVKTGSCQCYKNCDCCLEKGQIVDVIKKYTFSKCKHSYDTLDKCRNAIKSKTVKL